MLDSASFNTAATLCEPYS